MSKNVKMTMMVEHTLFSPPGKQPKVLALHPSQDGTSYFQVIDGFRVKGYSQGCGFSVDLFGRRAYISLRHESFRTYWEHRRYYFHFRQFGKNAPFRTAELSLGPLRVDFTYAYSGQVLPRGEI